MKYDGVHAQRILAQQLPDGSWGQFHSLSTQARRDHGITTEMALRRLQNLGFTLQDECIRRAVGYMDACLRGEKSIPDPCEKTHNWNTFTELMLATWIRRFTVDNAPANRVAKKWAHVLKAAFAHDDYDHSAYCAAFEQTFAHKPHGGRFVDFVSFYPLSLTKGCLDEATVQRMVKHVLHHPAGVYYVCEGPLAEPPEPFAGKKALRWLAAVELLAEHPGANVQLGFAREYLERRCDADGYWDLSAAAKDHIALPLSDSWHKADARKADCTARIRRLMEKL